MKETARDRLMYQTGRAAEYLKVIYQYVEKHGNDRSMEIPIVAAFF